MFSWEEFACALLLIAGLYLPTSVHEQQSSLFALLSFVVLLILFLYLAWKHGTRPGAVPIFTLPIMIILGASTLCALISGPFRFGWGVFALFGLLAMLLALDLRTVRSGRFVYAVFAVANILNIACGIAILVGNEWIAQFLPAFYSHFYPELVPNMIRVHRPVLTFSTHSLAGLFLYLFFWLNWETYKIRRTALSLFFAISELILLVALTSFTSLALATLALAQIFLWLWKRSRNVFVAAMLCVVVIVMFGGRLVRDQLDELPELGVTLLNTDNNGPLVRYGPGGDLRPTMAYLYNNPLSPIGFATPSYLYIVDSGPLEYLLRGSLPLLVFIYFGLYRFLRYNLALRSHALTLFLVIIAFETGFTAFTYFRTLYLLPFFVIYLKQIAPDLNCGSSFYAGAHQSIVGNAQP